MEARVLQEKPQESVHLSLDKLGLSIKDLTERVDALAVILSPVFNEALWAKTDNTVPAEGSILVNTSSPIRRRIDSYREEVDEQIRRLLDICSRLDI